MKRRYFFPFFFLLAFSLFNSLLGGGEEWLEGWDDRQSHAIGGSVGAGTGYQIPIWVDYATGTDWGNRTYLNGECNPDFSDIRFTENDGVTLLDYWLEYKVDYDEALFWVEFNDSLDTDQSMYVYWDNSSATSLSNIETTMLWGDEFSSTLNASKWDTLLGSISTSGGYLELIGDAGAGRGVIESKEDFSYNISLMSLCYGDQISQPNQNFHTLRKLPNTGTDQVTTYGSTLIMVWRTYNGGAQTQTVISWDARDTTRLEHTWTSGEATLYVNRVQEAQHTTNVPTTDLGVHINEGTLSGYEMYIDWICIRKWITSEPTHGAWGSKETLTPADNIEWLTLGVIGFMLGIFGLVFALARK